MNRIMRAMDRVTAQMDKDKFIGKPATFVIRTFGEVDVDTGVQEVEEFPIPVRVRSWPISVQEVSGFTQAGITEHMTRWCMRAHYVDDIQPGYMLYVLGFQYEVMQEPAAQLDEHGIDWVIYTRRMRV